MPLSLTGSAGALGRGGLLGAIERRAGITPSGVVALALGAVGWGLARLVGGRGLYLLVYCGLAAVAGSVVAARRPRALQAERSDVVKRAREGQPLDVEIRLSSARRLAMFTIEEKLPPALGAPVRVTVDAVSPTEGWSHRYTIRPKVRGVYEVGPLCAVWNDPLGLAQSQQELVPATEVLVHPTVETVFDRPLTRQLEDPPIRPPKTKPWPSGFEFYGMRDYVPGDDLRRVVWRAVARTGRMLVRESEQGVTDAVNIVIDTGREWHRPAVPSDTLEAAVRVAASVGAGHIKNGFSVSVDTLTGPLALDLRGPRARMTLLDGLARVGLEDGDLGDALERLLLRRARSAHNVVVTPHFSAAAAARANLLVQAGASVLVVHIAWEEADAAAIHRASEIGAQVVQVRPGAPLAGVFAHALGAGTR